MSVFGVFGSTETVALWQQFFCFTGLWLHKGMLRWNEAKSFASSEASPFCPDWMAIRIRPSVRPGQFQVGDDARAARRTHAVLMRSPLLAPWR